MVLIFIAFYCVLQFYMSCATCGAVNAYPFGPHKVTPVRVANLKIFICSHLVSLSMVHFCVGTLLSFSIVLQFVFHVLLSSGFLELLFPL